MNIRVKVLSGFVLIALIGLAIGVVGLFSVQTLSGLSGEQKTLDATSSAVVDVLNAHYDWRSGLLEAVLLGDGDAFNGSLDPTACAFGKWIASDQAKSITDPAILSLLQQVNEPHTFIHTEAAQVIDLLHSGNLEGAKTMTLHEILPKLGEVTSLLNQAEDRFTAMGDELSAEVEAAGARQNALIVTLIVAAIAACAVIAFILTGWIVNNIHWYETILDSIPFMISVTNKERKWTFVNKAVEDQIGQKRSKLVGSPCSAWDSPVCSTRNCGVDRYENGQPTTIYEDGSKDFKIDTTGIADRKGRPAGHIEILQEITTMVETQKAEAEMVGRIKGVSQTFVAGSGNIADGAQALAAGATEQAASIQQLSGSMSEIAEKTKRNAEIAKKTAELADSIKGNAEKGSHQMDEMIIAVQDINQSSHNISRVIKVIDDIAFQTNILALNAAVEAARAGQHGKGFAVVADEVRNLAAKSAVAAKDTESLIANSVEKSELGVRIAGDTSASLAEIVSGVNDSTNLIMEMATSSDEQSRGITQINIGIDQVAQVVQQNSATAEQSAASAQEMRTQARSLEQLIEQFGGGNESMNEMGMRLA